MKKELRIPVILTGTITALIAVMLSGSHCCHLNSIIIGVSILILTPILSCMWTAKANSRRQAWLRFGLSIIFAIAIQLAYLTWLHSSFFPQALLSRQSIEETARIQKMKERFTHRDREPHR